MKLCHLLLLFAVWTGASLSLAYAQSQSPIISNTTPPKTNLSLDLNDLTKLALDRNPRISAASFAIDAARGQALQAGLYPNPTIGFIFDELGDVQGPKGINTLPLVTQEIVTGGKLKLSRAVACKDVDQATLALMNQRYSLLAEVRAAYFEVVALQTRVAILSQMVRLSEQSTEQTAKLLNANQVSRLDLVQLEVERERLRADLEAGQREMPGAQRKLAAVIGAGTLPNAISGTLDIPLPPYDLDRTQQHVLSVHPEIRSAQVNIEKARLKLRREQVQPIPNVTIGAGYVRQNQNRSDDYTLNLSVPVPLWNRNQGNIATAVAQLGEATQLIGRVENELTERVASAVRDFAAARSRAERYRDQILPRAKETYDLSFKAYQGGQFEYLRVLEAQRAMAQANLEYVRSLGDAWKSASAISGLALEDQWPPVPSPLATNSPERKP